MIRPIANRAAATALALLFTAGLAADTVVLRNGRRLRNVRTRIQKGYLRVTNPRTGRTRRIPIRKVRSIFKLPVRKPRPRPRPRKRLPTPTPVRKRSKPAIKPRNTRRPYYAYTRALPRSPLLDPPSPQRRRQPQREPARGIYPTTPWTWWAPWSWDWPELSPTSRGYIPGLSGLTGLGGVKGAAGWTIIATEVYLAWFTLLFLRPEDTYPGETRQLEQLLMLVGALRSGTDPVAGNYAINRLVQFQGRVDDPRYKDTWIPRARHEQLLREHAGALALICLLDAFLSKRWAKTHNRTAARTPGGSLTFTGLTVKATRSVDEHTSHMQTRVGARFSF